VLIFEVLLNATSMFNHGNVRIAVGLDRVLRWIVVTPDIHRVHHSILPHETNSNFGFDLPWWDRLLGTYRAQPGAGREGMTLGIEQFEPRANSGSIGCWSSLFAGLQLDIRSVAARWNGEPRRYYAWALAGRLIPQL
jgi:hypothetical protein